MKRILVCEDEDAIRDFVVINLVRSGYDVVDVSCGEDAVKVYTEQNGNFDVALLDINLPDGNGFALFEDIKKTSQAPVIFLTAKGEADDRLCGLSLGADDYIVKPFLMKELVLRVTERKEKAVILGMNTHAVIDGEGYVLSIGTRASYEGLLKVYGTGAGGYHVNQRLGEESDFHSRTLVTLLAALENAELLNVVETLDISNPLSITMTTFDGLAVQLGQPDNAEEKLNNFRMVLPALIENDYNKSGTLDLSAKGSPVYSPPDSGASAPIDPQNSPEPGQTPEPDGTPEPDETPVPSASPTPTGVPEDPYSG